MRRDLTPRAPKDVPVIFSAPMVRALLDGRKSMTRRLATSPLAKVQPGDRLWVRENWCPANSENGPVLLFGAGGDERYLVDESYPVDYDRFPAGRGAWCVWASDLLSGSTTGWRPSIHMPRWASRLTLEVQAVKVERLQDISEEDARAEGVSEVAPSARDGYRHFGVLGTLVKPRPTAKAAFADLWEVIHGQGTWMANQLVVALSFQVHRANIDALPALREPAHAE